MKNSVFSLFKKKTSNHKKGLACYQFKYCSHYQPIYKYTQSIPVKSQDPIFNTVVSP